MNSSGQCLKAGINQVIKQEIETCEKWKQVPHGKNGKSDIWNWAELVSGAGSTLYNLGRLFKLSESPFPVKAKKKLPWSVEKF